MRFIGATRYGIDGASSRVRTLRFKQYWSHHFGGDISLQSFFGRGHSGRIRRGKNHSILYLFQCYLRRGSWLRREMKKDDSAVLWIEKEIFPYVPFCVERLFLGRRAWVHVDFDDAIHLNYRRYPVAVFGKAKIYRLVRRADSVSAGSAALCRLLRRYGAKEVFYVPSGYEARHREARISSCSPGVRRALNAPVKLGWIGSFSTKPEIDSILRAFGKSGGSEGISLEFHIMGPFKSLRQEGNCFYYPWSEGAMAEFLERIDIGLMPLAKTRWNSYKCAYKIIQYMAHSKPVVASAVGENRKVLVGFAKECLAADAAEFVEKTYILAGNPSMAADIGAQLHRRWEDLYSDEHIMKQLNVLLNFAYATQLTRLVIP